MRTGNPVWERFERNAHRTFEEAAEKYLREFDGKDKKRQRYCIEALAPYIGHLKLNDVDADALEAFKEPSKPWWPMVCCIFLRRETLAM